MPQNGIHAIAGIAARRWMPIKEWLLFGLVLGNMLPDLDNLAVAYATLTKADTHGLHRTFTHSIFTVAALLILFYIIAVLTKNPKWWNFGLGLGIGIVMHILLDLVAWFNGVELFWPIRYELNFWSWFTTPAWLKIFMDTGEFLAFGLFFSLLGSLAHRNKTDGASLRAARGWAYVQFGLFALFTFLFFFMPALPLLYTISGALYLISSIAAIVLTVRMRQTVETV
jgi:membrane-bound metal-dependent hydrolase YbcI (DUF457 family)